MVSMVSGLLASQATAARERMLSSSGALGRASPNKTQFDHVPDYDSGGQGIEGINRPRRHEPFRTRLEPRGGAGEQQREWGQPRPVRRLAEIAETLGADEILRHAEENQRKAVNEEIGVDGDDGGGDERLRLQIARPRRDRPGYHRHRDGDPDRPGARARPLPRPDPALGLTVEKAKTRRHQSLKRSLMPVFARVCASTVLTITAQ